MLGLRPPGSPRAGVRFDPYEFDADSLELKRNDVPVPLEPQPAAVLALLIENAGRVVPRRTIRERIWGSRAVEADDGINYCIRRIRCALEDEAEAPRYIRTVPRRGYTFVARVEPIVGFAGRRRLALGIAATAVATLLLGLSLWIVAWRAQTVGAEHLPPFRIAVHPLQPVTPKPWVEPFGRGLTDVLTTSLASLDPERLEVIVVPKGHRSRDREHPADYDLQGAVSVVDREIRVALQLVGRNDERILWARELVEPKPQIATVVASLSHEIAGKLGVHGTN